MLKQAVLAIESVAIFIAYLLAAIGRDENRELRTDSITIWVGGMDKIAVPDVLEVSEEFLEHCADCLASIVESI